jgi:hypothetical protein
MPVPVVERRHGKFGGQVGGIVNVPSLHEGIKLPGVHRDRVAAVASLLQAGREVAIQSGGPSRIHQPTGICVTQDRRHVTRAQRADKDPFRLLLPIRRRGWHTGQWCRSGERLCCLAGPEAGNDIATVAEVVVDLL